MSPSEREERKFSPKDQTRKAQFPGVAKAPECPNDLAPDAKMALVCGRRCVRFELASEDFPWRKVKRRDRIAIRNWRTFSSLVPFVKRRLDEVMIVAHPTHPYRMLIADDDSGFRRTLRGIFEPHFFTFEAESGEEAIEIAESESLDIALLDMQMHVMTGLETLQALKSVHLLLPCILITADASEELRQQANEADAFSVLAKPIRINELVLTVSSALELPADGDWPRSFN